MDRRIHVAKRPFIGRDLAVGMHVPFAQHENELVLGVTGIDQRQRDAVKCQVPGRIPWVLPFIGHGNNVRVVDVSPRVVAAVLTLLWRHRLCRVADQPLANNIVVILLGPQQSGKGLTHYVARVIVCGGRNHTRIKLISFGFAACKRAFKFLAQSAG